MGMRRSPVNPPELALACRPSRFSSKKHRAFAGDVSVLFISSYFSSFHFSSFHFISILSSEKIWLVVLKLQIWWGPYFDKPARDMRPPPGWEKNHPD